MGCVDGGKFNLAMSILNNLVGIWFADLRAEERKSKSDAALVEQLKARFYEYYATRERLHSADDVELQTIIDKLGPQARDAMQARRQVWGAA